MHPDELPISPITTMYYTARREASPPEPVPDVEQSAGVKEKSGKSKVSCLWMPYLSMKGTLRASSTRDDAPRQSARTFGLHEPPVERICMSFFLAPWCC